MRQSIYYIISCLILSLSLSSCGGSKPKTEEKIEIEYFNVSKPAKKAPSKKSSMDSARKTIAPVKLTLDGTPEENGLAIILEAERRDIGFVDFMAEMEMILKNKAGSEAKRKLRTKVLEVTEDGDKALLIFDHPKDIQGTALLTHSHKDKPDDQWVYLPDLKRVKRIASSNKSGPFMGSEFSYEDLSDHIVEKYSYKQIADDTANGEDCYVIEEYPHDPKSGYTKQVAWLDKKHLRAQKVEYYDRKNSHLKTLIFEGYQIYLDKYWRPDASFMQNHQTQKSTRLTFFNYEFQKGLIARNFDKKSLESAR